MKTNKFKIGFFAAAFALCSVGAKAQTLTPTLSSTPTPVPVGSYTEFTGAETENGEGKDYVTVGSKMAYKQDGDASIAALSGPEAGKLFNFSYFQWLFSGSVNILDPATGNTAVAADPSEPNYYNNLKEIYAIMPTTTGTYTITVNEKSRPKIGTGCEGTPITKNIEVVNRPTIQWNTTDRVTGGCTAVAVSIPVTIVGYSQYEIQYEMKYYTDLAKSGTPTTTTSYLVIPGNTLDLPTSVFSATGAYEITIKNITDRISRKSLDQTLVASIATDIPVDTYTVYIYPTPTTNKLQHVKNMP